MKHTPADLIDAIVDNMRQNLEELRYTTLAPSRYTVYLSQADFARLEGIIPRMQAEATRALDEEMTRVNKPSALRRLARGVQQLSTGRRPPLENAGPRWHIEFLPDSDGDLAAEGDIIVHSDLVLAPDLELGVGERTRRITTVRSGDTTTTREKVVDSGNPRSGEPGLDRGVYARITYTDNLGNHNHPLVRDQITIGRGGLAYPVDVRVSTSEDVSREHARIRRDASTGQFYLIDLSTLGTTLNGRHVPRGVEDRDGVKRENGQETALPPRARIGLAETVFLDFEQVGS
jgi:FHA domain-containing protein